MLEDFRLKEFSKDKAKMLNPLQLAIVGDAVYEVFVRTYIISENENLSAHKIHRKAIEFVKAQAQSKIMHKIEDELLEDEKYIYKRERNSTWLEYVVSNGFIYINRREIWMWKIYDCFHSDVSQ